MNKSDHFLAFHDKKGRLINIDILQVRKAAVILRALNHPLRQQILQALEDGKASTVTKLIEETGRVQSIVSQHLAILRRAGIVNVRREGKYIFYSLHMERLVLLNKHVLEINNK